MHFDLSALFTAATLVLGPSPVRFESAEMTQFQRDLLNWCICAGVRGLDDREQCKLLLQWFFAWEYAQERAIDTHTVGR